MGDLGLAIGGLATWFNAGHFHGPDSRFVLLAVADWLELVGSLQESGLVERVGSLMALLIVWLMV